LRQHSTVSPWALLIEGERMAASSGTHHRTPSCPPAYYHTNMAVALVTVQNHWNPSKPLHLSPRRAGLVWLNGLRSPNACYSKVLSNIKRDFTFVQRFFLNAILKLGLTPFHSIGSVGPFPDSCFVQFRWCILEPRMLGYNSESAKPWLFSFFFLDWLYPWVMSFHVLGVSV
jgi:hypothetical protein